MPYKTYELLFSSGVIITFGHLDSGKTIWVYIFRVFHLRANDHSGGYFRANDRESDNIYNFFHIYTHTIYYSSQNLGHFSTKIKSTMVFILVEVINFK